MSLLNVLQQVFSPGGPGFAVPLFVVIIGIGSLIAIVFQVKGDYLSVYRIKRLARIIAFPAALLYTAGWLYFVYTHHN